MDLLSKIIAFIIRKGGTGKTFLLQCLIEYLSFASPDEVTLVVECDSQGDITAGLGCERVDEIMTVDDSGSPVASKSFATYMSLSNPTPETVDGLIVPTKHANVYMLAGGAANRQIASKSIETVKAKLKALTELGYTRVIFDVPSEGVYADALLSVANVALIPTGAQSNEIRGLELARQTINAINPGCKTLIVPTRIHTDTRKNKNEVSILLEMYNHFGFDTVSQFMPYRDAVVGSINGENPLWGCHPDIAKATRHAAMWLNTGALPERYIDATKAEVEKLQAKLDKALA